MTSCLYIERSHPPPSQSVVLNVALFPATVTEDTDSGLVISETIIVMIFTNVTLSDPGPRVCIKLQAYNQVTY